MISVFDNLLLRIVTCREKRKYRTTYSFLEIEKVFNPKMSKIPQCVKKTLGVTVYALNSQSKVQKEEWK